VRACVLVCAYISAQTRNMYMPVYMFVFILACVRVCVCVYACMCVRDLFMLFTVELCQSVHSILIINLYARLQYSRTLTTCMCVCVCVRLCVCVRACMCV